MGTDRVTADNKAIEPAGQQPRDISGQDGRDGKVSGLLLSFPMVGRGGTTPFYPPEETACCSCIHPDLGGIKFKSFVF